MFPALNASQICNFRDFVCLFVFETKFLCVALVSVLELALVDQVDLELIEICLPLPPKSLN